MEQVLCQAEVRTTRGKGAAHKIRRRGLVPAVLYSKGGENVLLAIEDREVLRVLSTPAGLNIIVNLKIKANGSGSDDATAMISEVQRDVFQRKLLHVDFHRIRMDEKVHTTVPLTFHGHARGEREGGMTDHIRYEVDVEGLPAQLPEHIDVDVSELVIGDSLHVRDLKAPEGVTILTDPGEMVVVVHAPRAVEEAAPVAAEAAEATPGAPAAASAEAPATK